MFHYYCYLLLLETLICNQQSCDGIYLNLVYYNTLKITHLLMGHFIWSLFSFLVVLRPNQLNYLIKIYRFPFPLSYKEKHSELCVEAWCETHIVIMISLDELQMYRYSCHTYHYECKQKYTENFSYPIFVLNDTIKQVTSLV